MQDDSIHWNGEPVAVVLAETQEQADHAASLIAVAYESSTPRTSRRPGRTRARPTVSSASRSRFSSATPRPPSPTRPTRVDLIYRTPRHNHNAIEPHAVTLAWEGDDLIVHDASQGVKLHAWTLAQVFGIEEEQVHLTSPYVGGGFGGKTLWHIMCSGRRVEARRASRRVTLSREGVYRLVGGRTNTEQRVAIGADDDGRFTALIHTGISAMTPHNALRRAVHVPARGTCTRPRPSRSTSRWSTWTCSPTPSCARPGESVGTFALESAIDELADRAGHGPDRAAHPQRAREGPELGPSLLRRATSSRRGARAPSASAGSGAPTPGARREGEWLVGMGCATATYPYYRLPGGAARITA